MPEAVLRPEKWGALKLANCSGVDDKILSERFEVSPESIRQRRFRDPVWKATFEALKGSCNLSVTKGPETAFLAKKTASTISENAESLSSSNLLLASQIAQKGLKRAAGEIEHLPLENIADIERIFKMAAVAGKWAQPQVNVQQAFAFGGGQADDSILECETTIVEDGGNYGDAFNLTGNDGES